MYAKCGSLVVARELFDQLQSKGTMAWSAISTGYAQKGLGQEALRLYDCMHEQGVAASKAALISVLKACGKLHDIQQGKHIHDHIKRRGLENDVFVASTLIDMYSRCGSLWDARLVFEKLETRDVVVWNAMISAYAHHRLGDEVLHLYGRMLLKGMTPHKTTYVSVLKACGNSGSGQEGKRIHAQIMERGCDSDAFVGGALMDMYVKGGNVAAAHSVFNRLARKSVVTWNILIGGYVRQGLGHEALDLFKAMQQEGVEPDTVTFVSTLKACGRSQAIAEGKNIHAIILCAGLERDLFVASALMDMYARCGFLEGARELFDRLETRDVVVWNAMVAAYVRRGLGQDGIDLYFAMQETGVTPNNVTYVSALNACSSIGAIQEGRQIHADIVARRGVMDESVGNALVDMYVTCGSLGDARNILDGLPTTDSRMWSTMLTGYSQQGLPHDALDLYKKMQQYGMSPANAATYVSILKACANLGALQEGRKVHAHMAGTVLELDNFIGSTLIDMYCKCGDLDSARAVFEKLPAKDVVAWTALIHGYSQHKDCEAALGCFDQMRNQGIVPDAATFTSVFVACSYVSKVDEGERYFTMMTEEYGITPAIQHHTAMVDLFSRSGHLDRAHSLLLSMETAFHAAGCWRSLLNGCKSYCNRELGRLCFNRLVELEPGQAAGYVLMANIYANEGMWQDVDIIQKLKRSAGAQKKPALASIEIKNQVHEFIVGEKRFSEADAVYGKLKTLSQRMRVAGHVPDTKVVLQPVSEKHKEDALCGHAEKLAIAFGLLHTPEGETLLVVKNLRMCNDCHNGTKVLSRTEGREIIVRDAHCVHRFKNGSCSCRDYV